MTSKLASEFSTMQPFDSEAKSSFFIFFIFPKKPKNAILEKIDMGPKWTIQEIEIFLQSDFFCFFFVENPFF